MPPVSKTQARFMFAHAKDKGGKLGTVAREFTSDLKPGSIKKLPQKVKDGKPRAEKWYDG